MASKPEVIDPYKVLGIEKGSAPDVIKKAHKKLALKWHPDKNPDNPEAELMFTKIQEAYEILQDDKTREAYDNLDKARKARDAKIAEMDKKRKAEVDKLNEREEAARNRQDEYGNAKRKFEAEIARMREQNKKMMEDAAAKRRAATENAAEAAKSHMDELQAGARRQAEVRTELSRTVKVKWPKKNSVDKAALEGAFVAFGEIESCVCLKKSGMIVFKSDLSAANASHAVKAGLVERAKALDMSLEWVLPPEGAEAATPADGNPPGDTGGDEGGDIGEREAKRPNLGGAGGDGGGGGTAGNTFVLGAGGGAATMPSFSSFNPEPAQPGDVNKDYESLTMMRMRQAAERKRLAEQMMAEEDAA